MKRVALVGALALGILLMPTSASAQDTSQVSFVHASTTGAVDLFVGAADAPTVGLAAADVTQGEVVDLGALTSGSWRFLLCAHVPAPPSSVAGCLDVPASTTIDKNINIGVDKTNEVVLGLDAQGGLRLNKFNVDTSCVSPGGRLMAGNASQSGPATVTFDGTVVSDNFGSGKQVKQNVSAGSHDVTLTDGASLNLASVVDVPSQVLSIAYVAGNPSGYTVLVHQVALDCSGPPPTDPTAPTTAGADTAAANANRTTGVSPRYAG